MTNAVTIERRGDLEVVITRAFNAPKHLVYRAWTEPELVRRWLGANWYPWVVCDMDVRVGGKYRWVWDLGGPDDERPEGAQGGEMGISGEYRELVPNERIVNTERFDESWYAGEAIDTLTLEEHDGVTTCTTLVLCESNEAREAMINSGMAEGVEAGYACMDEVLAGLSA